MHPSYSSAFALALGDSNTSQSRAFVTSCIEVQLMFFFMCAQLVGDVAFERMRLAGFTCLEGSMR